MKRRDFLRATMFTGGALAIGINFAGCAASRQRKEIARVAKESGVFRPNAFVTVRPDGMVEVLMPKSEMGQGITTGYATMVAEELEVELSSVIVTPAPASKEYGTSSGGMQITGGSTSTMEAYIPLRTAAATAREMLLAAAAATWGVSRSELSAEGGVITHAKGSKSAPYAEFVLAAAEQDIPEPKLKDPSQFKLLGKPTTRVDGLSKIKGEAIFGIDVQLPGMLRASIVRPPVLGGEAISFDASESKKVPGVVDIFSFERGVVIVAEKYWQTKLAKEKLTVEWSEGTLAGFDSDQVRVAAAEYSTRDPANVATSEGNVSRALKDSANRTLEVVYEAPYLAHAPMEPMNCTAHYQKSEDKIEIWAPTQGQTQAQMIAAKIAGVPQENAIIHTTYLGGGFGRRGIQDFVAEAATIAVRFDRPVQLVWSREEDTQFCYYRPQSYHRFKGAIDKSGMPVAWSHHSISQAIIAQADFLSSIFPGWIPDAVGRMLSRSAVGLFKSGTVAGVTSLEGAREIYYDIPNLEVGYTPVRADVPVLFWRSVGHSFNGFVTESFIDELAHLAKQDPFIYRQKLLAKHPRQRAVLELAARKAEWGKKMPEGRAQGIAQHHSFGSYCAQVVEGGVEDGKIVVDRVVCVIDCGMALNPDMVKAQMEGGIIYGLSAAIKQEITFEDGAVQQANFDTFQSLRMFESPEIEVHILNTNNPPTGVGEPGLPPAAPALANAIFAATGKRLRKMPLQAEYDRISSARAEERGEQPARASLDEEVTR